MKTLLIVLSIVALSGAASFAGENCGNPACKAKATATAAKTPAASPSTSQKSDNSEKEKAACQKTPSRGSAIAAQKEAGKKKK